MIKNFLIFLFRLTKAHRLIYLANEADCIASCNASVTNNGGYFWNGARVYNLRNDRSSIVIGKDSYISGELKTLNYGGKIKIGNNSYIGSETKLWSGDFIDIGNNVLISHNVHIVDTNSHEVDYMERANSFVNSIKTGGDYIFKGSVQSAPIIIEDCAWINFNSIILKGVTIGKGAIIAAGSVVTKNIPPFVLAGGNPARVLKTLNESDSKTLA